MLKLARKPGESIRIGENIYITVQKSEGKIILAIDAPREVNVTRLELIEAKSTKVA